MRQEFYSNGKLLISGEYAILDGAQGWAIPTKYGQYLRILPQQTGLLSWASIDETGAIWFEATYRLTSLNLLTSSDNTIAEALQKVLREALRLNPSFLKNVDGVQAKAELSFPRDWGLGSSSTLINNIANWSGVDPYNLLKTTFGGSGYDIACAQHPKPILFQLVNGTPNVKKLPREIPFKDSLYFVYLNQKQNSRDAIAAYRNRTIDAKFTDQITQITKRMVTSQSIDDFQWLMQWHEQVLSDVLGIETIQSKLFPDYSGAVKSLGAWGGDFVLATGDATKMVYFKEKGYNVIIPFSQMIL